MRVLITGVNGFIGKNLMAFLLERGHEVLGLDKDDEPYAWKENVLKAEYIVHLAGVNRPLSKEEFVDGNVNSLVRVVNILKENDKITPIILSSSSQAIYDNPYGKSKKAAEDCLFNYQRVSNNPVYVFRFQNVFGKWSRPNYNSMVATFCYNISHNLDIQINETAPKISFLYIDDLCAALCDLIEGKTKRDSKEIQYIPTNDNYTPKEIADMLYSFKESRNNLQIVNQGNSFIKKLYATYLSFLDEDDFAYDLISHFDSRGSFTEILKSEDRGQFSLNIIEPGITKGNHYHHTKNEKFLVIKGTCDIKFRRIDDNKVITYRVSGDKLRVVDIPPGYTHNIKNIGEEKAYVFMWANELFDKAHPDTFALEV